MEYLFRVLIDSAEEGEGVFRDIAVDATANFSQLHDGIMEAFSFKGDQMASFYLSDEEWNKGDEIGLMDMSGEGSTFKLMNETSINSLVLDKGQKLIYVYDFLNMWCFFVELIDVKELILSKAYPCIERKFGIAPPEDSKNIFADIDIPSFDSDNYDVDDDLDDSFEFENIDDLDL